MKKKWYAISALFLGMTVAVADSGMPEWNGKNSFYSWKKQANVKVDVTPEALVLTEIKADPQVISGILAIDPSKYNSFKFRYRATGTGSAGGELYFASKPYTFSAKNYWHIPKLNNDGQWHTMTLTTDALSNPQSWTEAGTIVHLRFDPTNSAGGKIEISEMSFFFNKTASGRNDAGRSGLAQGQAGVSPQGLHRPGGTLFSRQTHQVRI